MPEVNHIPTINDAGDFVRRPTLDSRFRSSSGELVVIAAIWSRGVVFLGGQPVTATDLINTYKPELIK